MAGYHIGSDQFWCVVGDVHSIIDIRSVILMTDGVKEYMMKIDNRRLEKDVMG